MSITIDSHDIVTIVAAQRDFFLRGETHSLAFRDAALKRFEDELVRSQDSLLAALSEDLGKPETEAFVSEYFFLLEEVRLMRKKLSRWAKPQKVATPLYFLPGRSEIHRNPFGVTLVIAPWNYPVQLALSPVIAAVAAGNTVVLKPSEISTATEAWLVGFIGRCFDPELVSVVTGDADVSSALLDQTFDFIFFTGSTKVGRVVAEKAAKQLIPTVLELGGKCPCVIDASAELDVAARRLLAGKFFNGGQTCFAPDFVAVDERVKEKFVAACERVFAEVPWNEGMAHAVDEKSFERWRSLVTGRVIRQGEDDAEGRKLAPTILPDAQWDDAAMSEEVFGPILPVVTFCDFGELIGNLRGYAAPLALYVFSADKDFIDRIIEAIPSGGVCVNDTMKQSSNLKLPFGGVGESGHGRYRGEYGFRAFTYERAVVRRPLWKFDPFSILPPYEGKLKWLRKVMK